MAPRQEYERRIERWDGVVRDGERTHLRISNLRLATAGAAALIAWLAFGRQLVSPAWLLAAGLAFVVLVVVHARVLERIERGRRARRLYERGLERIDGTWAGRGPDGARFLGSHPYARDLDLFGPASLFQLLDTARTEAGEETLAAWIGSPAAIDEIQARHPAVAELAADVDFRETLAVLAAEAHVGRTSALNRWAGLEPAGASLGALAGFAACAADHGCAAGGGSLRRPSRTGPVRLAGRAGRHRAACPPVGEPDHQPQWKRPPPTSDCSVS